MEWETAMVPCLERQRLIVALVDFCSEQLEYLEDKLRELRFVRVNDSEQKVRIR